MRPKLTSTWYSPLKIPILKYAKYIKINASNISQRENCLCFSWMTFYSLKCTLHNWSGQATSIQKSMQTGKNSNYKNIYYNIKCKTTIPQACWKAIAYTLYMRNNISHMWMFGIHLYMSEYFQPHVMQICRILTLNNCSASLHTLLLSGMDDKKMGPQQTLKTVDGPKQIIQLQYVSPCFITFRQAHERVKHTVYFSRTTQHMVPVLKEMVVYLQHALRVTENRMPITRFMIMSFAYCVCKIILCVPGSSVSIVTDYGLHGLGSNPGGDEIFHLSKL